MYEQTLYEKSIKTMYGKKELKLTYCTATGHLTLSSGGRFRFVATKKEMTAALSGLSNAAKKTK